MGLRSIPAFTAVLSCEIQSPTFAFADEDLRSVKYMTELPTVINNVCLTEVEPSLALALYDSISKMQQVSRNEVNLKHELPSLLSSIPRALTRGWSLVMGDLLNARGRR